MQDILQSRENSNGDFSGTYTNITTRVTSKRKHIFNLLTFTESIAILVSLLIYKT